MKIIIIFVFMKYLIMTLIAGTIVILWLLSDMYNTPVLNRMQNYYEEDKDNKHLANFLIGVMIVLSFILGTMAV